MKKDKTSKREHSFSVMCRMWNNVEAEIMFCSRGRFKEFLRKEFDYYEEKLETANGLFLPLRKKDQFRNIIWMKRPTIKTISHELLHFCLNIMDECGVPISKENEETLTYFHSYMLSTAFEYCLDHKIHVDIY